HATPRGYEGTRSCPACPLPAPKRRRFSGHRTGSATARPVLREGNQMRRQESRVGGAAIGGYVDLPLTDQLPVDGSEDTALPLPQAWVGLSRFSHAHHRRRLPTFVREIGRASG